MKRVKVGDRTGTTTGEPIPNSGGTYIVYFNTGVEYIHGSKIMYLPSTLKSCYDIWREDNM